MKRLISIISCLALLLSLFTVFAFAEEGELSGYQQLIYEDAVALGFEEFIDVKQFVRNAGEVIPGGKPIEDYSKLTLIALGAPVLNLGTPYVDSGDLEQEVELVLTAYFYNPKQELFYFDPYNNESTLYREVKIHDHLMNETTVVPYSGFTVGLKGSDYYDTNSMFFCLDISVWLNPDVDTAAGLDSSQLEFRLYGLDLEDMDNTPYRFKFDVSFKEEDFVNYFDRSDPLFDLTGFLNLTYLELAENFPENLDTDCYPLTEPSLAFMFEDRNTESLYLYVYDEHHLGASTTLNYTTYCDISVEGFGVNNKLVLNPEYVSSSYCFVKFRISDLDDYFDDVFTGDSSEYYVTGFRYFDSEGNARYFNPNAEFSSVITYKDGEANVNFAGNYITLTDVKPTYHRLDSSETGTGYYQTLSSVYFSIPREYFELDDDDAFNDRWIERIGGNYTEYYTNIGIVTSDKELYGKLVANPSMKDDLYLSAGYINSSSSTAGGFYECRTVIGDIPDFLVNRPDYVFKYHKYFDTYGYLYSVEEIPENMEIFISSEEFLADIKSSENPFAEKGKNVSFDFNKEESFDLVSNKDWTFDKLASETSFFAAIGNIIFGDNEDIEDSIKNIKVFETLSGEGLEYGISYLESATDEQKKSFCKNYLTNIKDVPDILAAMKKARDNNDVFIFLRFDVYDYYCDFANSGNDTFVFQDKYYENFDILEIELANQYDSKLYLTRMIPISFVSDITSPSTDPIVPGVDITLPDFDFSFSIPDFDFSFSIPDWGIDWPDFSGFFTVLMIIGGVLLALFVVIPLLKKIFSTKKKE